MATPPIPAAFIVTGIYTDDTPYMQEFDDATSTLAWLKSNSSSFKTIKIDDSAATSEVKFTDLTSAFRNFSSLEELDLTMADLSKVTTLYGLCHGCRNLKVVDMTGCNTLKVKNLYGAFQLCSKLEEIKGMATISVSSVDNLNYTFSSCNALKLDIGNWRCVRCDKVASTFTGVRLDFTPPRVIGAYNNLISQYGSTFSGAYGITNLDLSGWNFNKTISETTSLFTDCNSVETAYAKSQEICDILNNTANKPDNINFIIKE